MKLLAHYFDFKVYEGEEGVDDFPYYGEAPNGDLEPFSDWDYMMDAIYREQSGFQLEFEFEDDE